MGLSYHASNMTLNVHSGAAFLIAPEAKSCIAGFFFLETALYTTIQNAPILDECKTLKHIVTSAPECEFVAVYHNVQQAIPIQSILTQIGHPHLATPFIMDNTITENFLKNNITQKRSKSWDMRYYWLREQNIKQRFQFILKKII